MKSLKNMTKTTVKKQPCANSEDFFEIWSREVTFWIFLFDIQENYIKSFFY